MYRIVHAFFYALSLLPFWVLYRLSDCGFVLMYYIVRYRRGVVRQNLRSSFPDWSDSQLRQTERGFYRWFCDYFIEAVKLLSISDRQLRRRFKIEGIDEVERRFAQGRDCGAILGHYCNWEWLSCVGIALPQDRVMGLIYHPLRSRVFDRLFRDLRSSQPTSMCVPKAEILRRLVTLRKEGRRSLFGYIADQGPKWQNIHLWLDFLGHETPVFTGAERIMRRMDNAVFYVSMDRPRRGYYTCRFRLLSEHPGEEDEFAVTRRFFEWLEDDIRREPRYYLWSHNRWKRTREEFDRLFTTINGKIVRRPED